MNTRTMSHYLIIMFMVMLLLFRFVVLFTTVLGINFPVVVSNEKIETGMLLITLISIILFTKTKLSGAIIYLVSSFAYYGPEFIKLLPVAMNGVTSTDMAVQILVLMIELVIPIFALFILIYDKKQELHPVDKKTDFFYKGDQYDRKYDERADKNNYRTL